jgi:hypothetical protein
MAVTSVQEMPDSPKGEFELGKYKLTRTFVVQTSDVQDGPIIVKNGFGVPRLFQTYSTPNESHPVVRCRNVECERLGNRSVYWKVTCTYESPEFKDGVAGSGGGAGGGLGGGLEKEGQQANPLLIIPELSTSWEQTDEVIYKIYNATTGNVEPCKNSFGEVFDPPPVKKRGRFLLTIVRNEDIGSQVIQAATAYEYAVNSDKFWGQPPGTALCTGITFTLQRYQVPDTIIQIPYLRVTYTFAFRDTWHLQVLDHGHQYKDVSLSGATRNVQFVTDKGFPSTGLLDGTGKKLPDGGVPVFLNFRVYPRKPFKKLNLPQSVLECQ